MASFTYNPNRARQLAAMFSGERDRSQGLQVRMNRDGQGNFAVEHHQLGGGTGLTRGSTTAGSRLIATHKFPTLSAAEAHLHNVFRDDVSDFVHRPTGQHLAVHVPQFGTQNSDLVARQVPGGLGEDDEA